MKKTIALLLSFIIIFSICGCNGNAGLKNTIWAFEFPLQNDTAAFAFQDDGTLIWIEAWQNEDENAYTVWPSSDMQYKSENDKLIFFYDKNQIEWEYKIQNDTLILTAEGQTFKLKKIESLKSYFNENGKTIGWQGSFEFAEEQENSTWWW